MLFETPKYNYLFILSLWGFTLIFEGILWSVPPMNIENPGSPPSVVLDLPNIMYSIFGAYIAICLSALTYNSLGPKLKKSAKNLSLYGIKSFATLVLVFVDLVSFMATEHDFAMRVFHLGNTLPTYLVFFVLVGFPLLGLFLTWNSRNTKLEYVVSH